MNGRRVEWPDDRIPIEQEKFMQPGDYAGPWHGMYLVCAPNGDWGSLTPTSGHTVTENADRSITVRPSIQFNTGGRWHGYLEAGRWRQC
jgi:hypothetical protein